MPSFSLNPLSQKSTGNLEIFSRAMIQIVKPNKLGGMGIRSAKHHNITYFLKLIWKAQHSPEKLWPKVINNNMDLTS